MNPAVTQTGVVGGAQQGVQLDAFLLEVADVANATLDLDTLLRRIAELVRRVIKYEIFAILLLNEKTQALRVRFSIGYPRGIAESISVPAGQGITGQAALRREAVVVQDVRKAEHYIGAIAEVRSELAIPLIVNNRVIGVLDIEAPEPGYFSEEHARLLTLIGSRLAVGIENARLYTRVSRQAQTLGLLNDISREITSILDLDQLLARIGELLRNLIDYQMYSVLLLDPTGALLQHRFSLRFGESVHIKHDVPLERGLVGYAARHKEPVLVPDVNRDARYIATNPETRSELCVPLIYKDAVIGVLDLEHTRRGFFNEGHVRTITTLAAQIAIAIENARLYDRIARQEQRLEHDLKMAREIQIALLPPSCPTLPNSQLAAQFVPALSIGGDLYDFLEYSGKRTGIVVGDVSGKGAPAALYAALVSGILRSTAGTEPSAAEMLATVNASLGERRIEAHFVCLLYAVWDDDARVMQIANSGLPRPIFCHGGKVQRLETVGLPLGLFEDADYDEMTISAAPGDVFLFFSDGIVDARSPQGELFGSEPVEKILAENCDKTAEEIVHAIFSAVEAHSAGLDAFDDETVVVVKISSPTKSNRKS